MDSCMVDLVPGKGKNENRIDGFTKSQKHSGLFLALCRLPTHSAHATQNPSELNELSSTIDMAEWTGTGVRALEGL